jgi:ABC-type Fe3+-siderophore transport system permease subunit
VRKNRGVAIERIAWIATVLVALLTALLLLLSGYTGYAGLGLAVALSAAVNLL